MRLGKYLLQGVKAYLKVKPTKSLHSHMRSLRLAMAQGRKLTQTGRWGFLCYGAIFK